VVTPADVRSAAHVFVNDLTTLELRDEDVRHLALVLRLRSGEVVTASDGMGAWRTTEVPPGFPAVALHPTGDIVTEPRAVPELTVGFALTKGDKPEFVVQKLTELGMDRILLFPSDNSVVRWDHAKIARNTMRLALVAREAAMQCRRSRLPGVVFTTFAAALELPGAALAERAGTPCGIDHPVVLIGPEGGWSGTERALATVTVNLGPQVLRAETAALAAGVLLAASRQDRALDLGEPS
jgi:16S rRNA (uracil1498-N3)-methyltransferase